MGTSAVPGDVNHDAPAGRVSPRQGSVGARLQVSTSYVETGMTSVRTKGGRAVVLLRQEIGDVLRHARRRQGRTLREVSSVARVSLGYLSEVERGQKEASSEILASVAEALDTPISVIMHEVGDRIAVLEGLSVVPDSLPDELVAEFDADMMVR